ncbi:hypothetical protein CRI94_11820 [Longibacter salinarum]|uniref:Uncharacterized protein n=1 Tax=Longibacter salinarum TaxID=1850348 RepID=A0A2A8CVC6_9BACT|nr:hypothetical protein CRI94_11820 [Longibacter salinarum]
MYSRTSESIVSPFEYLLPLTSVLVGLAIADLATSLHRLLEARRRVQWDWLPLLAALLALLAVLDLWWGFYGYTGRSEWEFAQFLPIFVQLVILFLLCASALPDEVPSDDGLDLHVFYQSNGSYFWFLYAAYIFSILAQDAFTYAASGLPEQMSTVSVLAGSIPNLLLIALFVGLALVHRRWLHMVAVPGLIVYQIVEWSGRVL